MRTLEELEDCYQRYWALENRYLMMPNTIKGKRYFKKIKEDIIFDGILDNNKDLEGTWYEEIPVFYARDYLQTISKRKILVSDHYKEIAAQLNQMGYQENIDYMDMQKFVSIWYWMNQKKIHVFEVHTAITTFCSLNCRNCNMFINHYDKTKRKNISLNEFRENVRNWFSTVEYTYNFAILGGEPFLNSALGEMLNWLYLEYSDVIGEISITTNGTVLPSYELLDICKQCDVNIFISDYGDNAVSQQKISDLIQLLEEKGIRYKHNKEMEWKNFYFPSEAQKANYASVREHMLLCNPNFRGLNDNKFYYCHIVWSAACAGLLPEINEDFVTLKSKMSDEEKRRFIAHDLGMMERGSMSLCQYCGGCGEDNTEIIPAGIQE